MENTFTYIAFFLTFFSVLFGVHFYVFYRLIGYFHIPLQIWHFGIIGFLAFSYVLARIIKGFLPDSISLFFYAFASVWLGILFFSLVFTALSELFRFIPVKSEFVGAGVIILTLIISVYGVVNARYVMKTDFIEISSDKVEKDIRIVQISDAHIDAMKNHAFLQKIVEKVNGLDPDIVVITGDFIDDTLPPDVYAPLKKMEGKKYFITGNHEHYHGPMNEIPIFEESGIIVLDDETAEAEGIEIIGVSYSAVKNHLPDTLNSLPIDNTKFTVLLHHVPEKIEFVRDKNIDLMLSGHTHAGQIFPFNLIVSLVFPYSNGRYDFDDTVLYVSPGTGYWGPPMRVGSRNTIAVIDIKKKE